MTDRPDHPEDPFGDLPPELRAMMEQLGGPGAMGQMQQHLQAMFSGGGGDEAVDWQLATRVALQVAADGDREPTPDEEQRAREALELAEHWLDATPLPAPPDAGRLVVGSRQMWVNAAVPALKPLVDPVARASTDAMASLAQEQLGQLGAAGGEDVPPELAGLEGLLGSLGGMDLGAMMRPMGAMLSGLQAGQVIGQLARQLLGQYELGIPTAARAEAHLLAVNADEAFDGWNLDPTEVALTLALTEAAHRRLYHAVPWLEAHLSSLVARFAAGTRVDAERLQELSQELMMGVDPDDPEALEEAMGRAADIRLEPTAEQRRVLERLQGVVCLVGAWARHEVARAVEGRLPSLPRIEEVLRRRRAERGDGERLLSTLLGLDLKPDDETLGERFVEVVEQARGPEGLRRALDHPENLPDAEEMADPAAWLERTGDDPGVPDDPSALFGDLAEAPLEASAQERRHDTSTAEGREEPRDDDGDEDGDGGRAGN